MFHLLNMRASTAWATMSLGTVDKQCNSLLLHADLSQWL